MLRNVSRLASKKLIPGAINRVTRCRLSTFEAATSYDSITDFGSYKNSLFTHRLPESTAEQSPDLVALHARLNLPKEFTYSTLSQALNLVSKDGLANNFGLNTIGKSLLSYYVSEYLLINYPRLPMPIHNAVVDAYMGAEPLYQIGKSWGIQLERNTKLEKYLAQEPFFMKYGRLRYLTDEQLDTVEEPGITKLSPEETESFKSTGHYVPQEHEAYASSVRAIIGGVYTLCGEEAAKKFIQDHVLSRKVQIDQMFQFSRPMRELERLMEKLGYKDPVQVRLVAETGRLSASPIYVTNVFCGLEKLGEGVGSSIREAKTRAAVNALMSYYLYSPLSASGDNVKVPSEPGYKFEEAVVGLGDVAI